MEFRLSASLSLHHHHHHHHHQPIDNLLSHFTDFISTKTNSPPFISTSISSLPPKKPCFISTSLTSETKDSVVPNSKNVKVIMSNLSVIEKSLLGSTAGGIAGAFTYVVLHPLDTIKTKLQTQGANELYRNGTIDVIKTTLLNKGILGFYSGVSAVIVGSTVSSAIYFGTCEMGKSVLGKLGGFPRWLVPPVAGAFGNIVSSAVMVPKELVTQRMQAGAKGRVWEVVVGIVGRDGVKGLYKGYNATLLRALPSGVLSYSSFEYLKGFVLGKTGKSCLDPVESVICGALAGAISATLTTPLDVVKTRLMTQVGGNVYGGVWGMMKQIMKEEGWVGLTRGMGPRVLHNSGFAALGYFAFETARLTLLHQYMIRKKPVPVLVYEKIVAPAS